MVQPLVVGVRVHQDRQVPAVQHQPGHDGGEQRRAEGDLEHRASVRPDGGLVPAPEPHAEPLGDPPAQGLGLVPRRRGVVIDVGVIAPDLGDRAGGWRHDDCSCGLGLTQP